MAWVRPKHPKPKVEVDPTDSLRPLLEYLSCKPSAPNPNNKQLVRIPKKQLQLHDSYEARPSEHHHEEELEHRQHPHHHHQRPEHHPRSEQHHRMEHHPRADQHAVDYDRASYHERASQRSASHYTREPSPPPPPPPPSSYRSNARPGAHLRLMPSRHNLAADTYIPRRPASRWASATTPLEI